MSPAANDVPLSRTEATRCSQYGLADRSVPHQTDRVHPPKSMPIGRAPQPGDLDRCICLGKPVGFHDASNAQ